jgi:hypothetical protein
MFIIDVTQSLEKNHVKYALVGGYAVALHGVVRGTVDVDIVITMDKKAFKDAEQALMNLGLQSRLPITAEDVFNYREEYMKNKNLKAWSFVDPADPSHMVDIVITEDLKNINTVNKKVGGINVKVASIPDLISLKKIADRTQDKEDIKALEKLL